MCGRLLQVVHSPASEERCHEGEGLEKAHARRLESTTLDHENDQC